MKVRLPPPGAARKAHKAWPRRKTSEIEGAGATEAAGDDVASACRDLRRAKKVQASTGECVANQASDDMKKLA